MVDARQEERLVALHPGAADHHVLEGERQRVPDMQRARHVGRRLDDRVHRLFGVRPAPRAVRRENACLEPALVYQRLDLAWSVCRGLWCAVARRSAG